MSPEMAKVIAEWNKIEKRPEIREKLKMAGYDVILARLEAGEGIPAILGAGSGEVDYEVEKVVHNGKQMVFGSPATGRKAKGYKEGAGKETGNY